MRMRRLTCTLFCLLACSSSYSQRTKTLVEGTAIKIDGVVLRKNVGNNAYIVIQPSQPYEAIFYDSDRKFVREIGICWYGQSGALWAIVGQKVTLHGLVQLQAESPYYFNGTCIRAESIQLQNGSILTPKEQIATPLPTELIQFHSLVTFTPHSSKRFTYETWDAKAQLLSPSNAYIHCGLNGPGDVMNCFCPDGFAFTGTGKIRDGHFSQAESASKRIPFAQFEIPDPVKGSVSEAVECTRPSLH